MRPVGKLEIQKDSSVPYCDLKTFSAGKNGGIFPADVFLKSVLIFANCIINYFIDEIENSHDEFSCLSWSNNDCITTFP